MEFSEWIRLEMEKRGWSQSEMARRMEVDPGTLGNVLNGNRQAGPDFCIAVARALGVSREEVFRARGWLLREPQQIVASDADPRLIKMAEAVRPLPFSLRERVLNLWASSLEALEIPYENISTTDEEVASWQLSAKEIAEMPAWRVGIIAMINSLTALDARGRAIELAKKYPIFKEAIENGRNPMVLLERLRDIGDALDKLPTKAEREAYIRGWQDSDPDVYEIAKTISSEEGDFQVPELWHWRGAYWGAGLTGKLPGPKK